MTAAETRDARKDPIGQAASLRLLREAGIRTVVATRGRAVVSLEVGDAGRADLVKAMIGPSGNLRAPAARVGRTLLVGFDEGAYREALG